LLYKNIFFVVSLAPFVFIGNIAFCACPSADLSGDCFVDYEDFTLIGGQWLNGYDCNNLTEMANQWLTTDPDVPNDMVYIPDGEFEMGDHFAEGDSDELPVHAVLLDSFFMNKFEITNQQYCDYLNDANSLGLIKVDGGVVYASSDGINSYPYCDTHGADSDSQIDYSGGIFSVRTKSGRDMSDDPMQNVSWYGAVAYCNWRSGAEGKEQCYNLSTWECDFSKHGYRLPTEAEWECAARGGEHSPYYRFPWGDTINHSYANYKANGSAWSYDTSPYTSYTYHPIWYDGIWPYTSPVGFFDGTMKYKADYNWPGSDTSYQTTSGANGYGLYGMAGNVWEWCNDWYDSDYYDTSPYDNPRGPASSPYDNRVLHGQSWYHFAIHCRIANRSNHPPDDRGCGGGFRIILSD